MSRLRHPINSIREPFGTAGLVVACIALIVALGGTAFAAAKLNSTQKKEVVKIAKKFAGKPGTDGTNGAPGEKGAAGTNGTNGKDGESVTVTESANAIEGHCAGTGSTGKGGSKFQVGTGTPSFACNGKEGKQGEPWTAGGTLPKGSTETGVFGFLGTSTVTLIPISFTIPLATRYDATESIEVGGETYTVPIHVHIVGEGENGGPKCTLEGTEGTVEDPLAAPGNLCIYIKSAFGLKGYLGQEVKDVETESTGLGKTGVTLTAEDEGILSMRGDWAVTGE